MKKKPPFLIWGICNFLSPLPLLIFGTVISWIIFFGIGGALYFADGGRPGWFAGIAVSPVIVALLAHIISSTAAIIASVRARREKHAAMCLALSVCALLSDGALCFCIFYVGSKF